MDKKGNLYIGSHEGQPVDPENPSLSHASFLGGIPAEMAGMISIDAGKIKLISDNSGHYAPEPLDMYRGIKKIQEKMPGALDKNCLILIQNKEPEPLKNFVAKMEEKVQGTGGKTHYEQLRENRISKIKEYQTKLKNVSKKTAVTQAATIGKDLKDTLLKRKQDNEKATGDLAANARRAKRANFIG